MCQSLSLFFRYTSPAQLFIDDVIKSFFEHFKHVLLLIKKSDTTRYLVKYSIISRPFNMRLRETLMRELIHNNLVPISHISQEKIDFVGKITANLMALHLLNYPKHQIQLFFDDFTPPEDVYQNTFTIYWLQDKTPQELNLLCKPFQNLLIQTLANIHFKSYYELLVWVPDISCPFVLEAPEDYVI